MPLGPQFRNTFHQGANGAVFHTDPTSLPAEEQSRHFLTKPLKSEKPHQGVAYQGMLMDPYAYTGHRNDPTISEEERRGAVRDATRLTTGDTPGGNQKYYADNKVPASKRPGYDAAIENAGYESGIPTHMFKNDVDVPVIVKKSLGKNVGGDYGADGRKHLVRVREGLPQREVIGQETTTEQSYDRGSAIHNPNFKEVLKTTPHWSGYGISNYSKVRSPEGEKSLGDYTDPTRDHQYKLYDPRHLPEGHTMNLWAGKGEDTDEYYTRTVKVPNGYTDSGRSKSAYVHFRHAKVPVGEPREVTRNIYGPDKQTISGSTLVHEIGHSIDPQVNDMGGHNSSGRNTVSEAIADGFEDRFHNHKDDYDEALHPSPNRATEIKKEGYGTNYRGLTDTDINRATYAAVRQHVSMGDNNYKDLERRQHLVSSATGYPMTHGVRGQGAAEGNKLLLGHLYTNHAHVREILGHLGLGHVGEEAAEHYRSQITDAGRSNNPYEAIDKGRFDRHRTSNFKQQAFPGMEE